MPETEKGGHKLLVQTMCVWCAWGGGGGGVCVCVSLNTAACTLYLYNKLTAVGAQTILFPPLSTVGSGHAPPYSLPATATLPQICSFGHGNNEHPGVILLLLGCDQSEVSVQAAALLHSVFT